MIKSAIDSPLVVGSGISGLGAILALVRRGLRPVVLDSALETDYVPLSSPRVVPYRARLTGSRAFITPGSHRVDRTKIFAQPSFVSGGFSTAWGGFIGSERDLPVLKDINEGLAELDLAPIRIVRTLFGAPSTESLDQDCAIGDRRLARCLKVASGDRGAKEFSSEGALLACKTAGTLRATGESSTDLEPWSTLEILGQLRNRGLIDYRPQSLVERVIARTSCTALEISTPRGIELVETSNKIFLALGAMSSAELLLRSDLASEVHLSESSCSMGLGLLADSKGEESTSHSMTQLSARDLEEQWFLQIYAPVTQRMLTGMMGRRSLSIVVTRFLKSLHQVLIPLLLYFPEDSSSKLALTRTGDSCSWVPVPSTSKQVQRLVMQDVAQSLSQIGIRSSSRSFFAPKPGASYHNGAMRVDGKQIESSGSIAAVPNMYLVDSSSLPRIEMGSTFISIFRNAQQVTHKAMNA